MSNPLLDSLNLSEVDDVNTIADGTYPGVVYKSEVIVTKDKGDGSPRKVLHVIGYRVQKEGDKFNGRQKDEMFELGINPRYAEDSTRALVGYEPSMSENQKPWYKARWVALGVPEEQVGKVNFDVLVGTPVDFGIKTNGAFQNISFARKRNVQNGTPAPTSGPVDPNAQQSVTTPPVTGTDDGPPF